MRGRSSFLLAGPFSDRCIARGCPFFARNDLGILKIKSCQYFSFVTDEHHSFSGQFLVFFEQFQSAWAVACLHRTSKDPLRPGSFAGYLKRTVLAIGNEKLF